MALLLGMASCGNKGKQAPVGETTRATTAAVAAAYELDSLLLVADNLVDKSVSVRGFVTHTCKHSGKRCFIVGKDGKTSFRVEATGEIGGFNRELVGSEIEVKGVVKERRLTAEFINQHEKEVNEQQAAEEDGSAESCAAELANIQQMRAWMKEHDKDYYSIYYMDGESYEVIETE
jgi:hypothetical protein